MRSGPSQCKLAVLWPKGDERGRDTVCGLLGSVGISLDRLCFTDSVDDLEGSGAEYVILAGAEMLHLFRPDLHPGLCHGRAMLLDLTDRGIIGFPIFHPDSYRRNERWQTVLLQELSLLKDMARSGFWSWDDFIPDTCVVCRGERHSSDQNGVAYCFPHWRSRLVDKTRTLSPDQAAKLF